MRLFWKLILTCLLFGAANLTDVTYYEILGVTKKASAQEIRQAYKKLAIKYHPDKNPNAKHQEKFLKITEAYETLKDPDKKRKYDVYGSQTYGRKYDYRSQSEYDQLFYKGLYHGDEYVTTISGPMFYDYLKDGFHFINYYSPFCPPCQNVADHWKKLAEMYHGIVKVGAVNCKYHNNFCYNNMRINSYPTLIFYPNGKNGNSIYYRGDRTYEALDDFVMSFLEREAHVPVMSTIRNKDLPMAYVLGTNRIEKNALTRIAYRLKGIVSFGIVNDDRIRSKLARDEYTTVVFKYNDVHRETESTDEKEILRTVVDALPKIEAIEPDTLKEIRNNLRTGRTKTWVLFFSSKGNDRLQLYQMRVAFPHMNFGEIDCDKWGELCASLHVEAPPSWGLLKHRGTYQRAPDTAQLKHFIDTAAEALRLHTLSASDFQRIINGGDIGVWVLLVAPYQSSWEHIAEPFTRTSLHFTNDEGVNFGIMSCTSKTDKYCRQLTHKPAVYIHVGGKRHLYSGNDFEDQLVKFIDMVQRSGDMQLTEKQVLEILDTSREQTWLVAYLPAHCGAVCDQLTYQWMLVANKLRPLDFVRVGVLNCASSSGFCGNIRTPTAKLYPIASGQHYSVNLENLSQSPYMLEWALSFIDDSVVKLNWRVFSKQVVSEELNPTGARKPWLVYFHSPRCFRCYDMYADFAIAGILLNNAVQLGKVNCINERNLCQHEQIMSYPSIKLYLGRNQRIHFSSVIPIQVTDYQSLMKEIKAHLMKYDPNVLAGVNVNSIRHDEF